MSCVLSLFCLLLGFFNIYIVFVSCVYVVVGFRKCFVFDCVVYLLSLLSLIVFVDLLIVV